ncbi:arginyltransferase [Pseudomarimonas salicorniae]|uniref:Aspartate/glutamate leucyltransferase n=1 Tax=Pseudomarimonas salicorniae TaxID=2933270 RepID=A0ABT0GIW7_9GAMM|nr:arginyltransferase [Lysobacter sp. CAU 1642]MCK7594149.1 arginyltransferase [Lysobacter sp. CAU 1642]
MSHHGIRVFLTAEHPCGYFRERRAQDLLLDPHDKRVPLLYGQALEHGFRRSGTHVYRPRCPGCRACQPLRVDVRAFAPSRGQRRCLRRNADIGDIQPLERAGEEHFALYQRYVRSRHPGGGMDQGGRHDFDAFVSARWSPTVFAELRRRGQLVAVAVTDLLEDGLSAVYTFFDPDLAERSLGTLAILRQIEWARRSGRRWLYLGFFIAGHPKMDYKRRFGPSQVLVDGEWREAVIDG